MKNFIVFNGVHISGHQRFKCENNINTIPQDGKLTMSNTLYVDVLYKVEEPCCVKTFLSRYM